ncbi:MAG: FAD-dependent oxidoreductase [Hyphomonadaceae bacterium]|jgi:3-phenylpropionate/trans-cinnamate dioxygenase ferredoxin reductase subunit|nr:FAD-dependent oxidoreductase [Hyphomonadaceae bacterium]
MGGVVIVGGGQAGFQVAASLREAGFGAPIALIGDEPGLPYQRPPLSKTYLARKVSAEQLSFRTAGFFAQRKVELCTGERVTDIDRRGRRVHVASGRTFAYDHLVLATGASNRLLKVPGAELDGVFYLRTLAEAQALRDRLAAGLEVVVIGAGFIGLEFAAVATELGARITVVEALSRPMARVVSPEASRFYEEFHTDRGARLVLGTGVQRILGSNGKVAGIETADGRAFGADLVVVGIGIIPNTQLAAAAGLPVENGIVVDEHLLTADEAISSIGDCAFHPNRFASGRVRLESVQNAVDQARTVAARLAGRRMPYQAVPWFWSDQGPYKLQIAGLTDGADVTVLRGDPASGSFSVFCFAGQKLLGVESINRAADHVVARRLLAGEGSITPDVAADMGADLKSLVMGAAASRHG